MLGYVKLTHKCVNFHSCGIFCDKTQSCSKIDVNYKQELNLRKLRHDHVKTMVNTTEVNRLAMQTQQVRNKWADWRMIKDHRKRQTLKQYGPERLRINSIRKNDILPAELREVADAEIAALPRDGSHTRIVARCCLTSRPRGVIHKFRVSRIVFRHLADYNKLSGVQRAMW